MAKLQAEWALWGKQQADAIGYRVLACSNGELDVRDFSEFIGIALTGSPSGNDSGDRSLPWLTIAPLSTRDPWLGVSITEASTIADATRRPVFLTRSYCFPFAALRSRPGSYSGLAQATLPRALPVDEHEPIPLTYPALGVSRIVRMIDGEVGFERAARAAALVVQGQTVITAAGSLTLAEKLDVLDAVAALLPYGVRSALAVGTWANSITAHRMRLCFSDAAAPGQTSLSWERPLADSAVPRGVAREYLELLALVRQRLGLGQLVEALTAHRAPMTFDMPEALVGPLEDLCRPFTVAERARTGAATVSEVREVVEMSDTATLSADERFALLRFLLRRGDAVDAELISSRWVPELRDDLIKIFLQSVAAGASPVAIDLCVAVASSVGELDELLSQAVRTAPSGGQVDTVLTVVSDCLWPWPHEFVATRAALLEDRPLLYTLLGRESGSREASDVATLVGWLQQCTDVPQQDLRAFEKVLADADAEVTSAELQSVGARAAGGMETLVATGLEARRSERVLPALLKLLPGLLAEESTARRTRWDRLLKRVEQGTRLDAAQLAKLDLARLLANERTTVDLWGRFSLEVGPEVDPYILSFCREFASLASPNGQARIITWAATILSGLPEAHVESALTLLQGVGKESGPSDEIALTMAVLVLIERSPELISSSPAAARWWAKIRTIRSLSARAALVEFARRLERTMPSAAVADLYVEAVRSGASPAEAARVLMRNRRRLSTRVIAELRPLLEDRLGVIGVPRSKRRLALEAFDDGRYSPSGRASAPTSTRSQTSPDLWSSGQRTNLLAIATLLVLLGGAVFALIMVLRNPAPLAEQPLTTARRAAVEQDYEIYWTRYLSALSERSPRGLENVEGSALERVRAEIHQRVEDGQSALVTPLHHALEIDPLGQSAVRLVVEYVVAVSYPSRPPARVRGSGLVTMRKMGESWKVVELSTSFLHIGVPLPRDFEEPAQPHRTVPADPVRPLL